jgi:hypothetical protein
LLDIPFGVSKCLYSGISDKISYIKRQLERNNFSFEYLRGERDSVKEALDFYNQHCVLSGKYLKDQFDEMDAIFQEKVQENVCP